MPHLTIQCMPTMTAPHTPQRRTLRGCSLTPSRTPFKTPSKTPSFRTPGVLTGKSPGTPLHRVSASSTPYYTPKTSANDRFIPSRRNLNIEVCRRALLTGEKRARDTEETTIEQEYKRRMFSSLCDIPLENIDPDGKPRGILSFGSKQESVKALRPHRLENPYDQDPLRSFQSDRSDARLAASAKVLRKVPTVPTRILDAPDIVDDYYLNLISWSKDNILAVALARSIYLWNATTGDIHHLATVQQGNDYITSVHWLQGPMSKYIAVGTNSACVHIFDGHALRKIRTLRGHFGRVASIAYSEKLLSSGSRDSTILNHDVRAQNHIVSKFVGHTQEVCGLKWNDDGTTLASGGNENYLCIWDVAGQTTPRLTLKQHKAAVKALDWCPFHRGLLASGGGTADRCIRFWNTTSGLLQNSIDTGSQVCSVIWGRNSREICSSHGYSENQLILWKYPTMTKIAELKGHTARVLNMELSPDGASVVSAAADETLRFWNVFGNGNNGSGRKILPTAMSIGGHTIR